MKTKIYLAPMSGISDLAFRLISRKFGARHCFFEMLDAKACFYNHPQNKALIKTVRQDSPISAQIVGKDPAIMLAAAEKILALANISFLDINSACPAKKIIKKGAGSALLKTPEKLGEIIKKLSSTLPVPVTVKLRTGFNNRDIQACVRTAQICQENGASTVFLHGRTRSQGYSGEVDYESIRAVKKALDIPVFGSGNILTPLLAKKMIEETGCDGILVARGAFGNPWIFKNIERYLKSNREPKIPSLSEKKKVLKKHLAYTEKYKDIRHSNKIGLMCKLTMWYLKGIHNAAEIRSHICKVTSYKELINLIDSIDTPK